MDSLKRSLPSQRSSPPSLGSWRRSEVENIVPGLDDALHVLARVSLLEGPRPLGVQARVVHALLSDGVVALHDLIRLTRNRRA